MFSYYFSLNTIQQTNNVSGVSSSRVCNGVRLLDYPMEWDLDSTQGNQHIEAEDILMLMLADY
jgi:hypothetical protein